MGKMEMCKEFSQPAALTRPLPLSCSPAVDSSVGLRGRGGVGDAGGCGYCGDGRLLV